MLTIVWRTIKDRRVSLIVYLAAAVAFTWMYVAMFPSIARQAEALTAVFENFPSAVFEVFGIAWRAHDNTGLPGMKDNFTVTAGSLDKAEGRPGPFRYRGIPPRPPLPPNLP